MWLTKLSIDRPAFITMVVLAMVVFGLVSYSRLGVDLFPALNVPVVTVLVTYPGATSQEMETLVTKPIEDAVSSIDKVEHVTSSSQEGLAYVSVRFLLEANGDLMANEVQRKVNAIRANLPEEIDPPTVIKLDPNSFPIIQMALSSPVRSVADLYLLAKDEIRDRLAQVPGVATVNIAGEREREIAVEVDRTKLESLGISIMQIVDALTRANQDIPSGRLKFARREVGVRVAGEFADTAEMEKVLIPVKSPGAAPIYLKDVANLRDTYKEQRIFSRINKVNSIGIFIVKQTDANTIRINEGVQKVLAALRKKLPADIKFTVAYNQTNFTRASLREVQENLVEGIVLTGIVLLFFLHKFRNTIIVLISIPTCLISTYTLIYFQGYTLNMMSLMGLALCIGILVDDSIVVLENIHRHLELGEEPRQAAYNGRSEIGFAAITITLVDVVVYAPIAFLSGTVGQVFRQFALVVVCATLLSLFISFTLTPMLASRWSGRIDPTHKVERMNIIFRIFERLYDFLKNLYSGAVLPWGMRHRWLVLLISAALLVAGISLIPLKLVGIEFFTQADRGEFSIDAKMPAGTSLLKTDEVARQMEDFLLAQPDVDIALMTVGQSTGRDLFLRRGNVFQCQVKLKGRKERKKSTSEVIAAVQQYSRRVPGLEMRILPIGLFGGAGRASLELQVRGKDIDLIKGVAQKIYDIVKATRGVRDARNSYEEGNPELKIIVDREKAAYYGLSVADVAATVRAYIDGNVSTHLRQGDDEYDIRVILPEGQHGSAEDVLGMPILSADGKLIRLRQVAHTEDVLGPTVIERYDKSRSISVSGNLGSRTLGPVLEDIRAARARINIPPGVDVVESGEAEDLKNTIRDLIIALLLSVLLVYMLMVALFESYIYPFIIMFSLPVALIGALAALALTGKSLSVMSMIGIIMLMGLVAKNAILIVDYTNTLRQRGMELREALQEAGKIRLRPIMMTTMAMVFGMLPLALALGEGSEIRSGMGVVIIGGLLSSLVLTVVLVPVVYTIVEDFRMAWRRLLRKGV